MEISHHINDQEELRGNMGLQVELGQINARIVQETVSGIKGRDMHGFGLLSGVGDVAILESMEIERVFIPGEIPDFIDQPPVVKGLSVRGVCHEKKN